MRAVVASAAIGSVMASALRVGVVLVLVGAVCVPPTPTAALVLDVAGGKSRCVALTVGEQVLAAGAFEVFSVDETQPSPVDVSVSGVVDRQQVYRNARGETHGRFAFTAESEQAYQLCFKSKSPAGSGSHRVGFEFNKGVGASDYTELASKEHLQPLEVELRQLEQKAEDIFREIQYQREREAVMRATNESTHDRVMWFSLFSIVVLAVLGLWQVCHLRSFFHHIRLLS